MNAALLLAALTMGQAPPPPPVTFTVTVSYPGYPTATYTVRHDFGAPPAARRAPTSSEAMWAQAPPVAAPSPAPYYGPDWAFSQRPPVLMAPSFAPGNSCPGGNCPSVPERVIGPNEVRHRLLRRF